MMSEAAGSVGSLEWARDAAAHWLDVPEFRDRRWRHVQAVGAKAEALAPAFGDQGELLASAAWLHDIGYAPALHETEFHPIDGGRQLLRDGAGHRLADLVANHSGAAIEAQLRDLAQEMHQFPDEGSAIRDALWACDMTTSPVGEEVDFDERLREITERYGAHHSVPRAISAAGDQIRAAIARTRSTAFAFGLEACF